MLTAKAVALRLFVLSLLSSFAWAQSSTTSLRGTVTDSSGASVAKADVTLSNPERALERTTKTGAEGGFEFLQIPPGVYRLTVQMTGFRKFEQPGIQLLVNTPATANVKLEIGTTSETIEVTGETTVVNTTDASIGNAFNENQIKALPMEGRNIPDLLSLQAGVAYTGNRTDIDKTHSSEHVWQLHQLAN